MASDGSWSDLSETDFTFQPKASWDTAGSLVAADKNDVW